MTVRFDSAHIDEAIAWRHDLHRHPELAFEEHRTSEFIARLLTDWGYRVKTGLAGTGVVATLGDGSGPSLGIRADIDALPIHELTGVAHASTVPGKMHACGHDGHTATLLLAARQLAAEPPARGTLHLIFQPAEEAEGGGRVMVEDGLFEHAPCDAVYALHNWPALHVGTMAVRPGPMMAAFSVFDIDISGRGGHAAMPQLSDDVVSAAARTATALQEIPARRTDPLDPAVLSVTQVHTGSAYNVCPDSARVSGTARWFSDAAGDMLERALNDTARNIAEAHGCTARVDYTRRYPATLNSEAEAQIVTALAEPAGLELCDAAPSMASEDFSFLLNACPGAYFWLGSGTGADTPGLHSPHFDFNDDVLAKGAELWVRLCRDRLG